MLYLVKIVVDNFFKYLNKKLHKYNLLIIFNDDFYQKFSRYIFIRIAIITVLSLQIHFTIKTIKSLIIFYQYT